MLQGKNGLLINSMGWGGELFFLCPSYYGAPIFHMKRGKQWGSGEILIKKERRAC